MKYLYCKIIMLILFIVIIPLKINAENTEVKYYVSKINKYWKNREYSKIKILYEKRLSKDPNDIVGLFTKIQYLILFGNNDDISEIESLSRKIEELGDNKKWGNNMNLELIMKVFLYDTKNVKNAIARGALGPGLTNEQLENLHNDFRNFPLHNIILQLGEL